MLLQGQEEQKDLQLPFHFRDSTALSAHLYVYMKQCKGLFKKFFCFKVHSSEELMPKILGKTWRQKSQVMNQL